jgi:O-antigen/teichoic acid export membrane protein
MSSKVAQVARNTLASYAYFFVSMGVQLALVPLTIRSVGEADYGLWALTFSVLGFFMLLDFGFGPGVVKYVARAQGAGDLAFRDRMVSTLAMVYLFLSVVALVTLLGLSFFYDQLFVIPDDSSSKAVALLLILGARTWAVGLPMGIFRGVLFGSQKITVIYGVQTVTALLLGAAAWWVLTSGQGIVALAWVNLGVMVIEHVAYVVLAYRLVPDLRVSPRLFDRVLLKEATSFGAFQFIVFVSSLVLLRTDLIIVQVFLSLQAVALYSVPLKIAEYSIFLVKPFINILTPLAAQLGGEGDEEGLRNMMVMGARVALVPAAIVASGAWAFSEEALVLWVGESFREASLVLGILPTALALSVPQTVISGVFTMTGRHRFTAAVAVAAMSVNLIASLSLVGVLGIVGVALGTLVAAVLVDVLVVLPIATKKVGLSYARYLVTVFLPPATCALAQYAVTVGVKTLWPPTNLVILVLEGLPGAITFGALFWLLFMSEQEKALVRRKLGRRSRAN